MTNFKIKFEMNEKGLSTFFKHKIFTVPSEIHKNWDYACIDKEGLHADFTMKISNDVLDKYNDNDNDVFSILTEMNKLQAHFTIQNNKGVRYDETKQFIKCVIPEVILPQIKKLFVSTIVYEATNQQIPQFESIEFSFDTTDSTVTITDITLFIPQDNPFFQYTKNAVSSLSVEAIGLENYSIDKSDKVKDFYNLKEMSKWKKTENLNNELLITDRAGVYMLYDQNTNTFYVGKAIKLKSRILQHKDNPNDPIPNFTHYRYSVISGEYYEFLYLIENAAIHDIAWILDMPKAQKLKPSLSGSISDIDLSKCKLVNTHEHQTRKQ